MDIKIKIIIAVSLIAVVAAAVFSLKRPQEAGLIPGVGSQIFDNAQNPLKEKLPEINPFQAEANPFSKDLNPYNKIRTNPFE